MKYVKINFENTNTTRNCTAITNLVVLPSIYDLHANFNEMKQLVYKLISNIVYPTKW